MRLLHTADWHLGAPNEPSIYRQKLLPTLFQAARDNYIKCILVVGDIFDRPNPHQKIKDYLLKQIIEAEEFHFILAPGNHDYLTKAMDYHSLEYLSILDQAEKLENVTVVLPGSVARIGKLVVWALNKWEDLTTMGDPLVNESQHLIATWHGLVPGINIKNLIASSKVKKRIDDILKASKIKYIALGDIHKRLKPHKYCRYPGPPAQKAYSDEDGLVLVSLKDKVKAKYIRLDFPKKITLSLAFEEGKDSEDSIISIVKESVPTGQLVKLKFALPLSIWSSINQAYIKEELSQYCLELKLDNDPIPDKQIRKALDKIAKAASLTDEIDIVIEELNFDLDKKKLKKICGRIVELA